MDFLRNLRCKTILLFFGGGGGGRGKGGKKGAPSGCSDNEFGHL